MKKMHWYVYISDSNKRIIEKYDIFDHYWFTKDLKETYKKYKNDFAAFSEYVRKDLMYYFWSKCEWEIILDHWPHWDNFKGRKIDVYDQISMNWDIFIKYVWDMCHTKKNAKEDKIDFSEVKNAKEEEAEY